MGGGRFIMKTTGIFGLFTFCSAVALAAAVRQYYALDLALSWLTAITPVTFLAYGYDKATARTGWMRVPEIVLLALTFAGGTAGALVARLLFRHKTVKSSFRVQFWIVICLQAFLISAYFIWLEPKM